MAQIEPTYSCFDDAVEFVVKSRPIDHSAICVVHGLCTGDEGELFGHAWVEDECNGLVWQAGLLEASKLFYGVPLAWFYTEFAPQKVLRYTLAEVAAHDFAGPWDKEIAAFVDNGRGIHKRVTDVPAIHVLQLQNKVKP